MLKLKLGVVVAAVCMVAFAPSAKADGFLLTATGGGNNVSLTLDGTAVAGDPGVFDITSASGTVDGYSATLLATSAPGAVTDSSVTNDWYIEYDNLLDMNSGSTFLDLYGLGLLLNNGTPSGVLANLYYSGGYLYAQLGDNPPLQDCVTINVVPTPEPGSLTMLLVGLLVVGALVVRKQMA
jgi:hypothetical protein